jgi:microsomal dipeptidase-like Zn-dependent dipeptidase
MDPIAVGQAIAEQRWWVVRNCGNGSGDYGFWLDNFMQDVLQFLGFGVAEAPAIPPYINGNLDPAYASCNQFGLQANGARLLHALMNKGMLIDIDHMSAFSLDETIAVTSNGPRGDQAAYPLLASHVLAFDLYRKEFVGNKGRHERMRTRAQLDAIRASGGLVAAMLKSDTQDNNEDPLRFGKFTTPYVAQAGAAIPDNCRHSSKTWAQSVQYLVDVMQGPVAMGSDFNGAAGHIGPRFGSDACGGWGLPNGMERPQQEFESNRVAYPFTLPGFGSFDRQVTGFKAFDFNVDGLAHVGLLPDLMADVQRIGMDQHYVDAVFCSAEAYVRVWERADALAAGRVPPAADRPWLCNIADNTPPSSSIAFSPAANGQGWHNGDVLVTVTATDESSGVERIDHSATVAGQTTSGSALGSIASTTIAAEGDTAISYFATDIAGNAETPNAASVRIDRTPPTIAASRAPAANAAGWSNGAVTVTFQCADALSGIAACEAGHVVGGGAAQSVSGAAEDVAGNLANAALSGINVDLTPPVVQVTGVAANSAYDFGSVPVAGCHTTDALSGVSASATVAVTGGTSNGVGTFTVTCSGATDRAGNTGSATLSYSVRYVFTGFDPPVDNAPIVNAVKAGQTVPVKFGLGGDFGLDVLQGGLATSVSVGCSSGVIDVIEVTVTNPGASQFAYDPVSGRYQFNWKTDKAWAGTCRRLLVRLDDGTLHSAEFRLQ